jgi:hypothetical protein
MAPTTITQNGTVIDGKDINGDLYIRASNVIIRRSWVRGLIDFNNATNLVVEDTEIGPLNHNSRYSGEGIRYQNYTCRRCYIHTFPDMARTNGNVLIEDSLLINGYLNSDDHADSVQNYAGNGNVTLRHNYIDSRAVNGSNLGHTAVFWADGADGIFTIENNVLAGGHAPMRLFENGRHRVLNNKIIQGSYSSTWLDTQPGLGVLEQCSGNTLIQPNGAFVQNLSC